MKYLAAFLLLLASWTASAQINCIATSATTGTPCVAAYQVGNGTVGDPIWRINGKLNFTLYTAEPADYLFAAPCGTAGLPTGIPVWRPLGICDLPGTAVRPVSASDPVVQADNGNVLNIAASAGWTETLPAIGTTGFNPSAFSLTAVALSGGNGSLAVSGGATINGGAGPLTFQTGTGYLIWSDGTATPGNYVAAQFGMPLSGTTGSIGGSALSAGQCTGTAIGVTGATTSMVVDVSPAGGTTPGGKYFWNGYVSALNTVTIQLCAAVAGTPGAQTYNFRVLQ